VGVCVHRYSVAAVVDDAFCRNEHEHGPGSVPVVLQGQVAAVQAGRPAGKQLPDAVTFEEPHRVPVASGCGDLNDVGAVHDSR
jgi:hypothetical protein